MKSFLSGNRVKANPLLLNPDAKVIGTFTLWENGHIDEEQAITDNPHARAFQVLVVQLSRQTFKASAQPIDKKKPKWWGPAYVDLVKGYMEAKRQGLMQLNERMMRATGGSLTMESQAPQQAKKK